MALFKSLFGKKDSNNAPKGFETLTVREVRRLTDEAVQIVLDKTPEEWSFLPGQYLNFAVTIKGKEHRRSYSLCSGPKEALSVAVKAVPNGTVSTWFNEEVKAGDELFVSRPEGAFTVPSDARHIVAVAAGSGITPILAIAKAAETAHQNVRLFYGNKTMARTLFTSELDALKNTDCRYFLSAETSEEHGQGRIDKNAFTEIIKADLSLLKADCFLLCGPEQLIMDTAEVLEFFGVAKNKIHYELFTTPVLMKTETTASEEAGFDGEATVTVHMDNDKEVFTLKSNGKSILEAANSAGMDAPYSCKGGVCSTCRAKVVKGKVSMSMNYVLSDREVEEGFVLTCQAHPASAEVEITYDF